MDSSARPYNGPLRQFSIFRDQRCRVTGGRIVDIDHIDEVQDGGPTSAGNGQGLAKNPHVIKDHPHISVRAEITQPVGDGLDALRANSPTVAWTMPTGHTYRLLPPPALGEGSRPTSTLTRPPVCREPESVAERIRELTRRVEQRPIRARKRRRPLGISEQRRGQRRSRRLDRTYAREDVALRRDRDDTRRRQARQARDLRRKRRERHPA